jgi:F-type H+-transporting ATPase subunit b
MLENRNFLVPDATLAIEMAAFVVVLVVMAKFVLPHISRAVHQRQDEIATALAAAAAADRQRQTAEQDAEHLLAAARRQARETIDQARSMRDHLITTGRSQGQAEYVWLSGRVEREADRRLDAARLSGRREAINAAVAVLHEWPDPPVNGERLATLIDERLAAESAGRDKAMASP